MSIKINRDLCFHICQDFFKISLDFSRRMADRDHHHADDDHNQHARESIQGEFRLGPEAIAIVPDSPAISKLRRPVVVSNFVGRQGGGTASVRPLPCEFIGPIGPFQTVSSSYCSSEGRPSSPPDRLIRPAFLCSQAEFSPWRPAGFLSRYSYSPLFSHGPAGPFAIDDDAEQATRRLTTGAKDGPGRGRR